MLRRAREREKGELADPHTRIQGDGDRVHVGELERDVAIPRRVDESGCAVNEQPEPSERAFSLHPRDHVVRKPDALPRRAEDELSGMQDEWCLRGDLHELADVIKRPREVDEGVAARPKTAEAIV